MRSQGAYTTTALLNTVVTAKREYNAFVSRNKQLCWVCQKDVPRSEGCSSFMIPKVGGNLTSGNAPRKFICFKCKPRETT